MAFNIADVKRQILNGEKYGHPRVDKTVTINDLRKPKIEELHPMTEYWTNCKAEPSVFYKYVILDKTDFPNGIDVFRKSIIEFWNSGHLFVKKT